jgi:hypothetical protein
MGNLVCLHAYRGHHSLYFFQDFQSAPLPANAFRIYRHTQETLLHLHGFAKNTLEAAVAIAMEDDS